MSDAPAVDRASPPNSGAVTAFVLGVVGFLASAGGCIAGMGQFFGLPFSAAGMVLASLEIRAVGRGERAETDLELLQPAMMLSSVGTALNLVWVGICGCAGVSYFGFFAAILGVAL